MCPYVIYIFNREIPSALPLGYIHARYPVSTVWQKGKFHFFIHPITKWFKTKSKNLSLAPQCHLITVVHQGTTKLCKISFCVLFLGPLRVALWQLRISLFRDTSSPYWWTRASETARLRTDNYNNRFCVFCTLKLPCFVADEYLGKSFWCSFLFWLVTVLYIKKYFCRPLKKSTFSSFRVFLLVRIRNSMGSKEVSCWKYGLSFVPCCFMLSLWRQENSEVTDLSFLSLWIVQDSKVS